MKLKPKNGEPCFTCAHENSAAHTYAIPMTDGRHAWMFLCDDCDKKCEERQGDDSCAVIQALCRKAWEWRGVTPVTASN